MAATKFGIVFSTGSGIIRRYIYPDNDSQLNNVPLLFGESFVQISNGPFANSAQWQAAVNNAIQTTIGKPPGDPHCAVVDNTNTVIAIIMADAAIDNLSNMTLIQCYAPIPIGSTYNPGTGLFTSPQTILAASPSKGRPVDVIIAGAVIPKP